MGKSTPEEKILYLLSITNSNKAGNSEALYWVSLKYLSDTVLKNSNIHFEELLVLNQLQKNDRFSPIEPRKYQGKINLGFYFHIIPKLFLHIGGSVSTPDFYPGENLPDLHKWGSLQVGYRY